MNISAVALIKYTNQNGDDLLDPSKPGALLADDIDVFLLKKGERIRLSGQVENMPGTFKILPSGASGSYLRFFYPNDPDAAEKEKVTIYLRYKNYSEDKLVGEFNSTIGPNIILQRIWINDIDKGMPSAAYTIVK